MLGGDTGTERRKFQLVLILFISKELCHHATKP